MDARTGVAWLVPPRVRRRARLARAVYYSFVTIATLGYGDIVPASHPARGLAILEAVSGQMYLAVLIARLVALYATTKN